MFLLFISSLLFIDKINGQVNVLGKPLVVLSAPSKLDPCYQKDFIEIIKFHISYAKAIIGKDNVLVLADKQTIPYLTGGAQSQITESLPKEIVVESDVRDIWIRDFGLAIQKHPVKLAYHPEVQTIQAASAIDSSFMSYLTNNEITLTKKVLTDINDAENSLNLPHYDQLVIDGGNIVYNGVDKAILTSRVYSDNRNTPDVVTALKNALGYNQIVIVTQAGTVDVDTTGHSDGMVSFIDTNTLLVSGMNEPEKSRLMQELRSGFGETVNFIELSYIPAEEKVGKYNSACGLHVNSLATTDYLYVPTFGDDAKNADMGSTVTVDNQTLALIRANTKKTVVPVKVPYEVCVLGGSVRCLSMQVEGPVADQLVKNAQQNANN